MMLLLIKCCIYCNQPTAHLFFIRTLYKKEHEAYIYSKFKKKLRAMPASALFKNTSLYKAFVGNQRVFWNFIFIAAMDDLTVDYFNNYDIHQKTTFSLARMNLSLFIYFSIKFKSK